MAVYVEPEPKDVLVPHDAPCQYQTTPLGGFPVRVIVALPQLAVGAVGLAGVPGAAALTVTLSQSVFPTHPLTVAVTQYCPLIAVVELARDGSSDVDV